MLRGCLYLYPSELFHWHRQSYHYSVVTMSAIASQITGVSIVYSTVVQAQIKRIKDPRYWFVRVIHRLPVNSTHKGPVTQKIFPIDDVIMVCQMPPRHSPRCAVIYDMYPLRTGADFTNDFSIVIEIRWKIHLALIQTVVRWSLWSFAHNTTAVLSWHVLNFVAIWYPAMQLH